MTWMLERYKNATQGAYLTPDVLARGGSGWDGFAHYEAACGWMRSLAGVNTWSKWTDGESCASGLYYDTNASACAPCAPGSYGAGVGVRLDACARCARGMAQEHAGMNACGTCHADEFADREGMTACLPCPAGATCVGGAELRIDPGFWRTTSERGDDAAGDAQAPWNTLYPCPLHAEARSRSLSRACRTRALSRARGRTKSRSGPRARMRVLSLGTATRRLGFLWFCVVR